MTGKWKVGLLEDNQAMLKDLKSIVETLDTVQVVCYATNSSDFISKVESTQPQILLLDIDLVNDSMTGLDVAKLFKLPVIFVSGKNAEHLRTIENLKFDYQFKVDFISKPYNDDHLKRLLEQFTRDLKNQSSNETLVLKFKGESHRILVKDIAFFRTEKMANSNSNNKVAYFTNKPPQTIIDYSFSKNIDSLMVDIFLICEKGIRVNLQAHPNFIKEKKQIALQAMNKDNQLETFYLPVSENYQSSVRNKLKK